MKKTSDFIIRNSIAILEGVAYIEEVKVVDDFLRNHPEIKYASVVTDDKRHFELADGKLKLTKEETFINPYYENLYAYKKKEGSSYIEPLVIDSQPEVVIEKQPETEKVNTSLENRILSLENQLSNVQLLLKEIMKLINISMD